jgi:hypothetical protein
MRKAWNRRLRRLFCVLIGSGVLLLTIALLRRVLEEDGPPDAGVSGTKGIRGQVFYPPEDRGVWGFWGFAEGEIYPDTADWSDHQPMRFKADKEGRFEVKEVEPGDIRIHIPFMFTRHIRDAHVAWRASSPVKEPRFLSSTQAGNGTLPSTS